MFEDYDQDEFFDKIIKRLEEIKQDINKLKIQYK